MPRQQRLVIYALCTALWASGLIWWLLDLFLVRQGEFGRMPHPLQPPLLLAHAVLALLALYLFGWISAHHALRWWPHGLRRWSGGVLAALLFALAVSGFALFFISDDHWQRISKLTHEALGVAVTLCALEHWLFGRRPQSVGEHPHPLRASRHSQTS